MNNRKYRNFPHQDFFDRWTPESAYLLGLLYADGHLRLTEKSRIVSFKSTDKQLIDLFTSLIDYGGTISEQRYITGKGKKNTAYSINFSGPVVDRLAELGLHPGNKSRCLDWPPGLKGHEVERDFMRGYFDGDGSASWTAGSSCSLGFFSGSRNLLLRIEHIAHNLTCWPKELYLRKNPHGSCWELRYGDAVDVALLTMYMYLYPTTSMCLLRKRDILFGSFGIKIPPSTPQVSRERAYRCSQGQLANEG